MPGLFLDIRNHLQVMDFIHHQLPYLPPAERQKATERLEAIEGGERISLEERLEFARQVARKSWPARRVVEEFVVTQPGCDEEWRMTVAAVSNSTAHLLQRFRYGTKCESLDQVLAHDESGVAFREQERLEIDEVRKHVREVIWGAEQKTLASHLKKQEQALKQIIGRFDTLRELSADAPWIQDQVFPKLQRFEDDLYFAGKILDVKELDEEIKYYREEKELPAEG